MKSQPLLFSKLSPAERQVMFDTIKENASLESLHKDMILELFAFVEKLLQNATNSKITISILRSQLQGFISEQLKKANQTA